MSSKQNHITNYVLRITFPIIILFASACTRSAPTPTAFPTINPFMPLDGNMTTAAPLLPGNVNQPIAAHGSTPTRAPLSIRLPVTAMPGGGLVTPTPDQPHKLPTPRQDADQYTVQAGDTLGSIAQRYGVSVDALLRANGIADANMLEVGAALNIPAPDPGASGPSFKIIPDSELVYGPASIKFDVKEFLQNHHGYLSNYSQDVNGETLTAEEIILRVSQNYSINPRLLIALLEYQSGWVSDKNPFNTEYPMGLSDTYHAGLYLQLTWAADTLNRGYYLWRANAIPAYVLSDGSVVPVNPTVNAGTVGVQNLFAKLDDRATWQSDVNGTGLFLAYYVLFGNPFDLAIEPLIPPGLSQPRLSLPFAPGETWSFTGGPHGGWDTGSAWAALDFAPPGEAAGCVLSPSWATAIADGWIVRAKDGAVIQDLDNDGYEQTGWVILYMHIDTSERVKPDTFLFANDNVGHPSCEGGVSNGTHLHIARKYNGEWIAADGALPFNMDGWISSGNGVYYDGWLTRGDQTLEAWDGVNDLNQITR